MQGKRENLTEFWWGKLKERSLGKLRIELVNNIKMVIKAVGSEGVDWIHLAHVRDYLWAVAKAEMEFPVSKNYVKYQAARNCYFVEK